MGAILSKIAVTVPSKAGISVPLEAVKEIKYRFFGFGIVFLFGGYLCRGCLHELQKMTKRITFSNFLLDGGYNPFKESIFGCCPFG